MKLNRTAAGLIALSLAAAPALGEQRQRRPDSSSASQPAEKAVPREAAPRTSPPPAPAPPPASAPAQAPRAERQRQPGRDRTPDNLSRDRAIPRTEPYRPPENRVRGNRPVIVAPRYYNSGRYYSAPYRGYRPYTFRPYTRIYYPNIYLGYSVPYAYSYSSPVSVYGWGRPLSPVTIGPASPYYGGVSLELWPGNAEVWVDGTYAGWVDDFDGTLQPLTLTAGTHRIEVYAPGFEPLVLDVLVRAGEVVPYRGSLVRRY